MVGVIEELRQNDPAKTCIRIRAADETSDAALAHALEQNPFVREIVLDLYGGEQGAADWDSLLRVIEMHANLETVRLADTISAERRNALSALVSPILQAIQQNTAI